MLRNCIIHNLCCQREWRRFFATQGPGNPLHCTGVRAPWPRAHIGDTGHRQHNARTAAPPPPPPRPRGPPNGPLRRPHCTYWVGGLAVAQVGRSTLLWPTTTFNLPPLPPAGGGGSTRIVSAGAARAARFVRVWRGREGAEEPLPLYAHGAAAAGVALAVAAAAAAELPVPVVVREGPQRGGVGGAVAGGALVPGAGLPTAARPPRPTPFPASMEHGRPS